MNEFLRIILDFKGYGNPKGKYWFIGLEESLPIDNEEKLKPYSEGILYNKKDDYSRYKIEFIEEQKGKEHAKRYTSVYDIIGKTLIQIDGSNSNLTNYLDENLFIEDGNNFYTILYPLGKPRISESLSEESLEFVGLKDMEEYRDVVKERRFERLNKLWNEYKPDFTICFGKSYWGEFDEVFCQDKADRVEIVKDKMYYYPKSKIYLVPFFVNFLMTREMIEILSTHIIKFR